MELDEVVQSYRDYIRFPQAVSASVKSVDDDTIFISTSWTQRDLEMAQKTKFQKSYCVKAAKDDRPKVLMTTSPQDASNEVWCKPSPSGERHAVVRKVLDKKKEEKQYIEIWDGSSKLKTIDALAAEKHGKIYDNDGCFGCFEWSNSEGHLLYVAEKKYPKAVSFFDKPASDSDKDLSALGKEQPVKGDEYVVREEWGEGLIGKHWPVLCVLDVDSGVISVLECVPQDVSPGLAVWAPDDTGVVFTGWCHEPYRLGLIYCPMRKGAIFYLDLQAATCVPISDVDRSSRSSVFSPDKSACIFLDNEIGGPHMQCGRLLKYDWASKKTRVAVDIVTDAPADDFQGIYVLAPPAACWCEDSQRVVINTFWRSQQTAVVIDTETSQVTRLPSDIPGNLAVLCVQKDVVVAQCSAPNAPHYLVAGVLPKKGEEANIQWCRLDGQVEPLKEIQWKIIKHNPTEERKNSQWPTLDYETVLLYPSETEGVKKKTLVVFPHGGPHSVFTTDFMLYPALLCKAGYSTLMVNYRGSVGFGNNSIYSLLGNIGDQDVKDVQSATNEVIASEGYDSSRVVVWGGSHGGFLTCHLIGQYPGFYKAAVCRNPVINLVSEFGTTDIHDWACAEAGIDFKYSTLGTNDITAKLWDISPLRYADQIKTPTLLMVGLDDRRVPPKQSYELYKALKARNVPVRYIAYPDNGHPIVKVDSEADGFMNIYQWFAQHLE